MFPVPPAQEARVKREEYLAEQAAEAARKVAAEARAKAAAELTAANAAITAINKELLTPSAPTPEKGLPVLSYEGCAHTAVTLAKNTSYEIRYYVSPSSSYTINVGSVDFDRIIYTLRGSPVSETLKAAIIAHYTAAGYTMKACEVIGQQHPRWEFLQLVVPTAPQPEPEPEAPIPQPVLSKHRFVDWVDPVKIYWCVLSRNPHEGAVEILQANPDKVSFKNLCMNPSEWAMQQIEAADSKKIDWACLSANSHPRAVALLAANPDKINWSMLSRNESAEAIAMLKANLPQIDHAQIARNAHPDAVALLQMFPRWTECNNGFNANSSNWATAQVFAREERNPSGGYIRPQWLSMNRNPRALAWLAAHPSAIDWTNVWANPGIFVSNE